MMPANTKRIIRGIFREFSVLFIFSQNRNQLIIAKMEQKINQQQIEIFKLKKKLKLLKGYLPL